MNNTGVSIIITIQNNKHQIKQLFESFFSVNTHHFLEFILIDVGSTDRTDEVVHQYSHKAFIRFIKINNEYACASPRNIGANKARHPFLLFLDPGIVFTNDILPVALNKFTNQNIGVVGVRLDCSQESQGTTKQIQTVHTGIAFKWDTERQQYISVYNQEPLSGRGNIHNSGFFTAVTGNFLFCRKKDFEAVGGFYEEYSNGFEDLDFCLQLSQKLNLNCWCINDQSLQISPTHYNFFFSTTGNDSSQKNDAALFKRRNNAYLSRVSNVIKDTKLSENFTTPPQPLTPVKQSPGKEKPQQKDTHLNILFVMYESIDSNGGLHAQLHAARLSALGAECRFAVPTGKTTAYQDKGLDQIVQTFEQWENNNTSFSNGKGPNVIHAWTPRECVRKFCEKVLNQYSAALVIHLEDNEYYLTETHIGRPYHEIEEVPDNLLDKLIPEACYHPVRGRKFLSRAQGITMIIDSLFHFNFEGVPSFILPPPVDERLFYPRPLNLTLRKKLSIPADHIVFAYTGNVNSANRNEVMELYRAVQLLNKQGHPATLIRTGSNGNSFDNDSTLTKYEKHLGWVERSKIPEIIAAADLLVQPGKPDSFNDQRIPSKLPEFFAIGRPIILPKTNLGLKINYGEDAIVLETADADNIATAAIQITSDKTLQRKLALNAAGYFKTHLMNREIPQKLNEFYKHCLLST